MRIESVISGIPAQDIRRMLDGLPEARGYRLLAKPLRYRKRAHLSAWTDFEGRQIVLQLPDPFVPFGEVVPYAARRLPGKSLRFVWLSEGVTFRSPREVMRFLYCHEWMHWYLRERLGRKAAAETACDRFALQNYRRSEVGQADAEASLRRTP